jgi:hypothetical protein
MPKGFVFGVGKMNMDGKQGRAMKEACADLLRYCTNNIFKKSKTIMTDFSERKFKPMSSKRRERNPFRSRLQACLLNFFCCLFYGAANIQRGIAR